MSQYERANPEVRAAVDDAFEEAKAALQAHGLIVSQNDAAAAVIDALVVWVHRSAAALPG